MVNSNISTSGGGKLNINEINIYPGLMYNKITITNDNILITTTSATGHTIYQETIIEQNTGKLMCVKHVIHKKNDGGGEEKNLDLNYDPEAVIDGKIQIINNISRNIDINNIFTTNLLILYTGSFDIESARSSNKIEYN